MLAVCTVCPGAAPEPIITCSRQLSAPLYLTHEMVAPFDSPGIGLTNLLAAKYQFVPQGLVFQAVPDREFHQPVALRLLIRGLNDSTMMFESDDVVKLKVLPAYVAMLQNLGLYLAAHNQHRQAIEAFMQALALEPANSRVQRSLEASLKAFP